jgi:hypothetical protein
LADTTIRRCVLARIRFGPVVADRREHLERDLRPGVDDGVADRLEVGALVVAVAHDDVVVRWLEHAA